MLAVTHFSPIQIEQLRVVAGPLKNKRTEGATAYTSSRNVCSLS